MNKKIFIIIAVAILVFFAGGIFIFLNRPKTNSQALIKKATTTTPAVTGKKSLSELMSSGGNLRCTYSQKETKSTVTLYLSGSKHMRTDTVSEIGDKPVQGHMIYDGKYSYQWFEENGKVAMGIKSSSENLNKASERNEQAMPNGLNAQQQANFIALSQLNNVDCKPWTVDASKFALPTGVEFTDYASTMDKNTSISTTPQTPASPCSVCDNVTGDSKTQCKAALKCN
jgi:hypothetical protein